MRELPKRSDTIYKEIESFEDYEYTNCIAYEMAIRNYNFLNNIKKSVLEVNDYFNNSSEKVRNNDSFCSVLLNFISGAFRDFGLYCISNFDLYKILDIKELNKIEVIKYLKNKKEVVFKKNSLGRLGDDESKVYDGYFLSQFGKGQEVDTIPYQNVVTGNFKRPLLKYFNNQFIELELNLALPEIELCAFIKKIKKDLSLTVLKIDTPSISLGEELDKADEIKSKAVPKDKLKRKKTMADAFYIYDTWKILEIHYAEKTKELKEKLKKEIQSIKNNFNYDKYDKKSKIDDAKTNNEFSLSNYTKVSLKTEIASQLNISIDTVDKLHTLMIKYIDNLKYKELITGLSN